ncbi:hypothetical protein FQN50_004114 [Emmonsiellopsis sp. PD_5]|nr:hypothetical protein FQN50_004114 [Emmonsiellopsis sp. PD_5]
MDGSDAVFLSSKDIISQPLPDLLTAPGFHTRSDSRHRTWYNGKLGHWEGFESDVKRVAEAAITKSDYLDVIPRDYATNPGYLCHEQCFCGDELSLSGRFTQNALTPAISVARLHGVQTRFGDFKTSRESQVSGQSSVPDYVAIVCREEKKKTTAGLRDHDMRIVGEAKTPWMHNLMDFYKKYWRKDESGFRRALGQIALYMQECKMMHGFLTTYQYTVFLMQRYNPKSKEATLYFSRPISKDEIPSGDHNNGKDSPVSVRQCLFYLMWITRGDDPTKFICNNPTQPSAWVDSANAHDPPSPATPHNQTRTPGTTAHRQQSLGPDPRMAGLPASSGPILTMQKDGDVYRGELQLTKDRIHDVDSFDPYIMLGSQKVPVIINEAPRHEFRSGWRQPTRDPSLSPSRGPKAALDAQKRRERQLESPRGGQLMSGGGTYQHKGQEQPKKTGDQYGSDPTQGDTRKQPPACSTKKSSLFSSKR